MFFNLALTFYLQANFIYSSSFFDTTLNSVSNKIIVSYKVLLLYFIRL